MPSNFPLSSLSSTLSITNTYKQSVTPLYTQAKMCFILLVGCQMSRRMFSSVSQTLRVCIFLLSLCAKRRTGDLLLMCIYYLLHSHLGSWILTHIGPDSKPHPVMSSHIFSSNTSSKNKDYSSKKDIWHEAPTPHNSQWM